MKIMSDTHLDVYHASVSARNLSRVQPEPKQTFQIEQLSTSSLSEFESAYVLEPEMGSTHTALA